MTSLPCPQILDIGGSDLLAYYSAVFITKLKRLPRTRATVSARKGAMTLKHFDTQHNDNQHKRLVYDTRHKDTHLNNNTIMLTVIMLTVIC